MKVRGHRSKRRPRKRWTDCVREDVTKWGDNMQMAVEKTKDWQQWREFIHSSFIHSFKEI